MAVSPDERYRSLFEHHPHPIFVLDSDGCFVEVNPAAGVISGRSADELLGMGFHDLVVPEDLPAALESFVEVLAGRFPVVELRMRHPEGHLVEVSVTGIPWVVDDEVRGAYGIVQDVTERNRVARELEITQQLAIAASQAKSDFVARMSHEIRTPLTSILATVDLVAGAEDRAERAELAATLQRSGDRLLSLVDGVLDFAASGAGQPLQEEFDLHELVRDTVALVEKSARRKGLTLNLRLEDDVPCRVRNHPSWTSQILLNLLHNAVENTETGHVDLSVRATTSATAGPAVLYRVTDTGVGIDPAHHDLVFEPFTRAPTPGSPTRRSTGLGLSIVKQLVTISGGTVALDNEPGRGSTFFALVPIEAAAQV